MSDMIRVKRMCPDCNKEVEIMSLVPDGKGHFNQILSCGHTAKYADLHTDDTISNTWRDMKHPFVIAFLIMAVLTIGIMVALYYGYWVP